MRVGAFMGAYFASIALTAFMPLFYADRGLSAEDIGQVLGTATFLRILSGPGWGNAADRFGRRRPVLLLAGLLATSMALLFLTAHGFWAIALIAAGQGIAASAINPLVDSLALALAREGKMEYAPVRATGSITFMLTTAAAGWFVNAWGSWLVPALIAAGYAVATGFSRLLPEAGTPPAAARSWSGAALLRNRGFRLTVAGSALIHSAHAAYYGFAALLWRSQGLSDSTIGLLLAEAIVVEIALFLWGKKFIERLGPAGLTAGAALGSIVRWGALAAEPSVAVLAAVQLLHAATFAMQHLSAMTTLSRAVPPERAATAQALHNAMGFGIPNGLMMLMSGWLYQHHGALVFAAMAAVGGAGLVLVRPLARLSLAGAPGAGHNRA